MVNLQRRRLLQSASLLVGSGTMGSLFAADAPSAPQFSPAPGFSPKALFLTWQRDPTTTMTIQWIGTPEEGAERPIWFAKAGSLDWRRAVSTPRPYPMTNDQVFRTELTGLDPDTTYHFRVGLDAAERKFRTMPAKATNTIDFISGGDSGIGREAQMSNRVAATQAPKFVLIGGDLAYENGVDARVFQQFLQNYSEQVIDDHGHMIPVITCIGNHEVRGGYEKTRKEAPFFYALFDGLFTDTGYAALDFGDYLSIVLLDTNHTSPVGGDQTDWLAKNLKQREERDNLFVAYHVPSYPSFRPFVADSDESGTGHDSRKHWVPLMERYNVDAVFEHHDHTYKRTQPLLGGHADANGIPYLGDGSWGKLRRPKTPEERPYLAVVHETYHLTLHRIEGKQRFHVALSDKGRIMDISTTKKRAHS